MNTNFGAENIRVEPKISNFFIPIELEFSRNGWIDLSAKINDATIKFWYKSYRTCCVIDVVRLASHIISSQQQKVDMGVK